MSRSKQNKSVKKDSDGKHRKETKEERRLRLQKQEEAREVRYDKLEVIIFWKVDRWINCLNARWKQIIDRSGVFGRKAQYTHRTVV